ncbi:hypothetical protein GCM10009740_39450 [Terrabacter terrae]|uniref:Zinc-ribbon domain-containing protein n=2 Tax=Terrabacter terrae TaxID=318434 RepID=A0ABN1ZT50_9MICO
MGNVQERDQRTPADFSVKARLECWWWCGKSDHQWFTSVPNAFAYSFHCPACAAERGREHDRVRNLFVAEVPELVAAWRDERSYEGLRVVDLFGGVAGKNFGLTYSLRCPSNHKIDTVVSSFLFAACPWCRGKQTRSVTAMKTLAAEDPELAALWHPTRNGDMTPATTAANHRRPLWWKAGHCCGFEWQETIQERVLGRRPQAGRGHYYCPKCESAWGSLAWLDPELASEWHPDNRLSAWHVKPFSGGVIAKWRCSTNPEHEWAASVIDRSSGRLCPMCSTAGTSQIEKKFLAAVQAHDPSADAATLGRWRVDVFAPAFGLIVEYDGEYWHRVKEEIDARKTEALVALGYKVARIRENDLPHLTLHGSRIRQISFRPGFGRVEETVQDLVGWARGAGPSVGRSTH